MGNIVNKMLSSFGFDPADEYEDEYYDETESIYEEPAVESYTRRNKVMKLHHNEMNASQQMKVVVMQPENFDEARDITNHLKERKPIVVNLEAVEKEVARRIVDFLSGAVFALDGDMQKISNGIFLLVPNNVAIMDDDAALGGKSSFPWGK